jgi:hypothetical protein
MGAPGVGVLTAAVGAGALAGSLGASALVSGRRLAALEGVGVALRGLPLALGGALHGPVVLALMSVIGIGNALADIGLYTLPGRLVPEELLARVFGAKESLTAMSVALGSLIAPPVIDLLGVRAALAALGPRGPRARGARVAAAARDRRLDRAPELRDRGAAAGGDAAPTTDAGDREPRRLRRPRPRRRGPGGFHQGDHGDRFYVIQDGEAEVIGDERSAAQEAMKRSAWCDDEPGSAGITKTC